MAPSAASPSPVQGVVISGCFVHSEGISDMTVLQNMAIGVSNSKIIFFEPKERLSALMKEHNMTQENVLELSKNQFIMPGFVDSHAHASQYSFMGTGSDLELLPWLQRYTYPTESRITKDPEFARDVYGKCVTSSLKNGTTTCSYYATIGRESTMLLVDAVENQGQRAYIGKVNMDINSPDFYRETCEDSVTETIRFVEEVQRREIALVTPCITPRFAITCSMELMKQLGHLAKSRSLPVQGLARLVDLQRLGNVKVDPMSIKVEHPCVTTHISENPSEIERVLEIHGNIDNYASVYDAAELLGPKTILAHGVHLTDDELEIIRERGSGISHCPNSNISLFSGTLDVRRLLAAKVKVGLGTDYAGGHSPSMLDAIRRGITAANVTSVRMRSEGQQVEPVTFKHMFRLATLGSSEVMGLDDKIGNFTVGKEFDAILVDADASGSPFNVFPADTIDDVIQKFIFLGDDRNITRVYVNGKQVLTTN